MTSLPRCILVHGIRHTFWRQNPMLALRDELLSRSVPSVLVDYGYKLVPLTNNRAITKVYETCQPGDVLVGFSNGAFACGGAVDRGAQAWGIVLVSAAMRRNWIFPENMLVLNYYNPNDGVLTAGTSWAWMANWMPWRWGDDRDHGWGDLGKFGYDGPSEMVRDIRLPYGVGHSWYNDPAAVRAVASGVEILWKESCLVRGV